MKSKRLQFYQLASKRLRASITIGWFVGLKIRAFSFAEQDYLALAFWLWPIKLYKFVRPAYPLFSRKIKAVRKQRFLVVQRPSMHKARNQKDAAYLFNIN